MKSQRFSGLLRSKAAEKFVTRDPVTLNHRVGDKSLLDLLRYALDDRYFRKYLEIYVFLLAAR